MGCRFGFAQLVFVSAASVVGQVIDSSNVSQPAGEQSTAARVYFVGPQVEAPVLLPSIPISPLSGKCKKSDVSLGLTLVVDASGQARNITFSDVSHPLSQDMEDLARRTIANDRFRPGTRGGTPVAVEMSMDVKMEGCIERERNSLGDEIDHFSLRTDPTQRLVALPEPPGRRQEAVPLAAPAAYKENPDHNDDKTLGPVPLNKVEAKYTDAARKLRINGICEVSVIVDSAGMPQNPVVLHSLDQGLDQKAIEAVMKYRFKPAMRNGRPIPVKITIDVNFRIGN